MRIFEVEIKEAPVDSSWIKDLSWTENGAVLTSSKDAIYFIKMPKDVFDQWSLADSKGQFFHKFVKNYYEIIRA